ncbi:MAG: hypothetical protein U0W24_22440 [Bacteroidales bacterium]
MRSQTINHKGVNIYYMDFSGIKSENEVQSVIDGSIQYLRNLPPLSAICLTNITDMHFNNQIKDKFQDFVKGNKPYIKASAVLGVTGLKQILFNGIMKLTGRDVKCFDDIETAKEWLIAHK